MTQQSQARTDRPQAQRGIPDTTKGKELDETYDKLREGMPGGEKKKRSP